MCTRFTSLSKILPFITIGAEELLPLEGNVIILPSEVRSLNLFFVYDSSCLIMSIDGKAVLISQLLHSGFLFDDIRWCHAHGLYGNGNIWTCLVTVYFQTYERMFETFRCLFCGEDLS
uniref:Uncharacterized protein n=1 Tax=Tanacetum cinerariifolium TaxID=118510 RepID=A0A6L2MPL8_TANCI|nr:hypothetical protein [Tanacetum cinerariifolium]